MIASNFLFLPDQQNLPVACLSKVFYNTTASYKFLWFLSILELNSEGKNKEVSVWDIIIKMVSIAWYPINYFHLSFGVWDSMEKAVVNLRKHLNIPIDSKRNEIESVLIEAFKNDKEVRQELAIFSKYVPYRFLNPWLNESVDSKAAFLSNSFYNECLYSINKCRGGMSITVNPVWIEYLKEHYVLLRDFCYWNFTGFLQKMNPNVPAIGSKILQPEERSSLTRQRVFWNTIIKIQGAPLKCIYTGKDLSVNDYDLDHFIPWSFVCHDLLWNLIPSDSSINSSKNDNLPDLDYYLPKLARVHQDALKLFFASNQAKPNQKILEDFLTLKHDARELSEINFEDFLRIYFDTFIPISQVALNMGFIKMKIVNGN